MQHYKSDLLARAIRCAMVTMICGLVSLPALGQMGTSSYSDAWTDENGNVYSSGITDEGYNTYSHQARVVSVLTSPNGRVSWNHSGYGGSYASAIGYLGYDGNDVGFYFVSSDHWSYCPYVMTDIYQGQTSNQAQTCTDTCTPCRNERHPKEVLCAAALATCEGTALANYNNALNACENNTFCQQSNPNYNEEECNRCRDSALDTFLIASGACAGVYNLCRLAITPDCSPHPTYRKANCDPCSNFPF